MGAAGLEPANLSRVKQAVGPGADRIRLKSAVGSGWQDSEERIRQPRPAGKVAVRDLARHRTVLVTAGHGYLARPA